MSKAEFSWIKDLISTDEKALGVYLAVLNLRFIPDDFEYSTFKSVLKNLIELMGIELELKGIERALFGGKAFSLTETFDAYVAFFNKLTMYVKIDLVLKEKSRNVLLERIEAEFLETFTKAYKNSRCN
jgi:Mor family transcriptional regulator